VADHEPRHEGREPLSPARKVVYGVVLVALALSALGFAYIHLHHSDGPRSAHSGSTTTTAVPKTTSTVAIPTALQPNADTAANALVSSWSTGNRAAALSVATPAAVDALFAVPYPSGQAQDRGCSTAFLPIVCTFGPPGGANPNDPIYEIYVLQAPGGWYVSSVRT